MRISTHAIPEGFVYPCSKRDVKEAFGEGVLEWASFGLSTEFSFESRMTHRPEILGTVVAEVTATPKGDAYLSLYRMRREMDSVYFRSRFREVLKGVARPWTEAMVGRRETENFGYTFLIIELREGQILTHDRCWGWSY